MFRDTENNAWWDTTVFQILRLMLELGNVILIRMLLLGLGHNKCFQILRLMRELRHNKYFRDTEMDTTNVFQIQRIVLGLGHNQCFPDTEANAWVGTQPMFSRYGGQCLGLDTTNVFQIRRSMLGVGHNKCFKIRRIMLET